MAAKRNPGAGGTAAGASGTVLRGTSGQPERSTGHTFTEYLSEAERRRVRRVWWNQRALGFRLPPERGIVVIRGGAR
jgi:hypothetical protein